MVPMELGERVFCSRCMKRLEEESVCPHCGFDPDRMEMDCSVLEEGTLLCQGRFVLGAVIRRDEQCVHYAAWDKYLEAPVRIREYLPKALAMRDNAYGDRVKICCGAERGYDEGCSQFWFSCREERGISRFKENGTCYQAALFFGG